MQWDDFVSSLKQAKKNKVKDLSVPTIATLLYGGAMDSMIPPGMPKTVETYHTLYGQVTAALKSKAKLAPRRKTEMIGLADVKGPISLSLWRHQVNPLAVFDIIPECLEDLKTYGFTQHTHEFHNMIKKAEEAGKPHLYLTTYWSKIFQNTREYEYFADGRQHIAVLGVISEVRKAAYADGTKERLMFKIYTGYEYTDEITIWPGEDGKISERRLAEIKPMELGFAIIKPKLWNGRPGAALVKWQKLMK